jgi:exosortase/archaeosortase family protein
MRVWQAMVVQVAACWSVWSWYVSRVWTGADEAWHLVAVLALVALGLRGNLSQRVRWVHLGGLAAVNVGMAVLFARLPMAVTALGAVLGLASLLSRANSLPLWHPAPALLAFLALPVGASVHFFASHPLKVATITLASPMLHMMGIAVTRTGSALAFGNTVVLVDAPCAGVDTLGVTLLLAVGIALLRLHTARVTWVMLALALVGVVGANAMRVCCLFLLQRDGGSVPPWLHEGVGLAAFLQVALVLFITGTRVMPPLVVDGGVP